MRRQKRVLGTTVGILLLSIAVGWFARLAFLQKEVGTLGDSPSVRSPVPQSAKRPAISSDPSIAAGFEKCLNELSSSTDPVTTRRILADLRSLLGALPRDAASREVRAFLASGRDAATKLDFTIKAGGSLGDASSLRVFLLDYLGQIDPAAAGPIAMTILSQYTTADEWAISLRNYAWSNHDSAANEYLQTKARELLANAAWRENPTTGFLEAFDAIVYAHGTSLTPELAALVRDKNNPATAHAAFLTLDRLTMSDPAAILTQLVERPELMESREVTRANFVARADIRQAEQRALVERYLLDPARSAEELGTFAGLYPNANYMVSNNLLTKSDTPGGQQLAAADREALPIIRQWEQDPRFERVRPYLSQIRSRLELFVQQAESKK